jgi:hypothetical protein
MDKTAAVKALARYEYLRTFNPRQFKDLWQRNVRGEGSFDQLVDEAIANRKVEHMRYVPGDDGLEHNDHPLRHWDRTCPACNGSLDQSR